MLGLFELMGPPQFRFTLSGRQTLALSLTYGLTVCLLVARAQEMLSVDSAEVHVGKGYEALKDERYQVATEEFQAALVLNPRLARARYQLGACLFALGKFQEARLQLDLLQKQTGGDASIVYQLARLDLQAGDFETAIKRLTPLMTDPPFPDTAYYLGTAYLQKGTLPAAEKWLQVAARADPKDYRVPERLAHVYQRDGRKTDSAKQFALSSQLRERYVESAQQAVACSKWLETKPLEEARPVCDRLFDPHDPDRLTVLGMLYGQHGRYTEAVKPLELANRLDPESFEINHNLGLSYFQLRRYGDARQALEKAAALCPDFYGSSALLGGTLYMLGDDEEAYRVLGHAHALNPENGDTSTLLFKEALILANKEGAQKNYTSALTYLRAAAELRPQDQEVQGRISQLLPLAARPQAPKRAE
jgi:protein O-GlcNAc transferase